MWQRILFPPPADKIRAILESDGYKSYDPFPGGAGSPIGKLARLRLFLTPDALQLVVAPQDEVNESLLTEFARATNKPLLVLRIQGADDYQITVYAPGESPDSSLQALAPFHQPGADLETALSNVTPVDDDTPSSPSNLPPELQQMAESGGLKSRDVDKMMGRVSKRLFRRMQKNDPTVDQAQAAAALAAQQQQTVDWNSFAARQLSAIMACLDVPAGWNQPDWKDLTAAYPLARQQQRGQGLLLPGDEATLARVPNAVDYTPLYFAKRVS